MEFDRVGRLRNGALRNAYWTAHVVVDQAGDGGFQRCREAKRLAIARQNCRNAADGWQKAHVEHAIGFVENQGLHLFEAHQPAAKEIFQTSGRGYDDPRSGAQGLNLRLLGQAADDEGSGRKLLVAQLFVLLVNLHRKFARGHQDQRFRVARRSLQQALNQGHQERKGFARAGLGGGQDVSTRKCVRDRFRLDGGGGSEISKRQLPLKFSGKRHF